MLLARLVSLAGAGTSSFLTGVRDRVCFLVSSGCSFFLPAIIFIIVNGRCTLIIINSANQIKMTLKGILVLLSMSILGGAGARNVDFSPPHILKGQYIQIEDIRAVIFNSIDGLNLYNQLVSGKGCINAIDLYVTDIEMMLDALIGAIGYDRKNR